MTDEIAAVDRMLESAHGHADFPAWKALKARMAVMAISRPSSALARAAEMVADRLMHAPECKYMSPMSDEESDCDCGMYALRSALALDAERRKAEDAVAKAQDTTIAKWNDYAMAYMDGMSDKRLTDAFDAACEAFGEVTAAWKALRALDGRTE